MNHCTIKKATNRSLSPFLLKVALLQLESKAETAAKDADTVRCTIEITAICEDTDILVETPFETATYVTVSHSRTIPSTTTTNDNVGSEVDGADRITEISVTQDHVLSGIVVAVPERFRTQTEVAGEEYVEPGTSTDSAVQRLSVRSLSDYSGEKSIHLKFQIAEITGFGFNNHLLVIGFGIHSGHPAGNSQHRCEDNAH